LEKLDENVIINMTWESIRYNVKTLSIDSLGY